jgi:hypothetical protein
LKFFEILVTASLVVAGLTMAGYFSLVLLKPLYDFLKSLRAKARNSEKKKSLLEFSSFIELGDYGRALQIILKVPYLDVASSTDSLLTLRNHNQDFVTKCLMMTEKLNTPGHNVANLEIAFTERFELIALLFKAQVNRRVLEDKRNKEGNKLPAWSILEMEKREQEISNSLDQNLDNIKREIKELSEIISSKSSDEMMIH